MKSMTLKVNERISQLVGSSTLAITARAKELKAEGKDVINFAGGEPDFDTPDSIKDAAIQAIKDGFTKYTPSTGTVQLKETICAKVNPRPLSKADRFFLGTAEGRVIEILQKVLTLSLGRYRRVFARHILQYISIINVTQPLKRLHKLHQVS